MPSDLLDAATEQLSFLQYINVISQAGRQQAWEQMTQRLPQIAHLEEVLDDATAGGLAFESAAMCPLSGEAWVTINEDQGGAWIAHLTLAGYRFADAVAAYRIQGSTAVEAKHPSGGRVVLRMREVVRCAG